jgi:hypothetical protein
MFHLAQIVPAIRLSLLVKITIFIMWCKQALLFLRNYIRVSFGVEALSC